MTVTHTSESLIVILLACFLGLLTAGSSLAGSPLVSKLEKKLPQKYFSYSEDAFLTPVQLIRKYGYRGENHTVVTEDGYILELHRITASEWNTDHDEEKEPVFLMHGLLSSSVDWIITGPDIALGYLLADKGYDVWMGNARGNVFSRKHTKYSDIDTKYWDFSWHEVGHRDVPTMIDYVLVKTRKEKLMYIGHSQGTTAFWVMASELPEYQAKVKAMFALAPIAYVTHVRSPFYVFLSRFSNTVENLRHLIGWDEFAPTDELLKEVTAIACADGAWSQPLCSNIIFLVVGFGSDQLNKTMLPAILGHVPAGASVRQVVHYGQIIKTRKFQQFDHGLLENLRRYKSIWPPTYDLSKIKVPVFLHYSSNDWMSHPIDVDRLYRELGNNVVKYRVPHDKFDHVDFIWANDGRDLLYNKIIGLMRRFRN